VEFVLPLIVGAIDIPRDNSAYLKSTWIVFTLGIIAFVCSVIVTIMDYNGNKILHNTPDEQIKQEIKEEEAEEEEAKK